MLDVKLNYWSGHRNFGDELSPYIVEKISGRKVSHVGRKELDKLIALGSILDFNNIYSRSHIWGSGVIASNSIKRFRPLPLHKIFRKNKFRSKIHALRGPLSKKVLESFGFNCANIYGDPAILMPKLYTPKDINLESRYGLILHLQHQKLMPQDDSFLIENGIKLISIEREGAKEIEEFIDEVCSCEYIFSTSLHGIIVAQSYGVPAQWLKIHGFDLRKDDGFKFLDYFRGAQQEPQEALVVSGINLDIVNAFEKNKFSKIKVFSGAEGLLEAFPREILK